MARLHVPGLSIAVIYDGKIEWVKAYGTVDADSGRPVTVETRFQAASISKPVTAMAVLRLVQAGRFALDDDINSLLKSWRVPKSDLTRLQSITPRSLLSHTSGADDGFGFPGYDPAAPLPGIVQILEGKPPSNVGPVLFTHRPYEDYKYSGGGILIMQLALTDRMGLAFEEIMQTQVLRPLGMAHSSFLQPPPAAEASEPAAYAFAHDSNGERMGAPWHIYPEQAAAGLWTTPSDLARFVIEIQRAIRGPSGTVLNLASAKEMLCPLGVGPFGIGLRLANKGPGWYFFHGGSNWGFDAVMIGHYRKNYGVVIMTNAQESGYALIHEMEARVATVYGWDKDDDKGS
jgi:CubicO group peptidase (beta-lactamase class C family)